MRRRSLSLYRSGPYSWGGLSSLKKSEGPCAQRGYLDSPPLVVAQAEASAQGFWSNKSAPPLLAQSLKACISSRITTVIQVCNEKVLQILGVISGLMSRLWFHLV